MLGPFPAQEKPRSREGLVRNKETSDRTREHGARVRLVWACPHVLATRPKQGQEGAVCELGWV